MSHAFSLALSRGRFLWGRLRGPTSWGKENTTPRTSGSQERFGNVGRPAGCPTSRAFRDVGQGERSQSGKILLPISATNRQKPFANLRRFRTPRLASKHHRSCDCCEKL